MLNAISNLRAISYLFTELFPASN